MKIIGIGLIATIMLGACAGQQSPAGQTVDYDGFIITVPVSPARGGTEGAQKSAIFDAKRHCESMRTEFILMNIDTTNVDEKQNGMLDLLYRCPFKRFSVY